MMRWSNLLIWIPVGAALSYLFIGLVDQQAHNVEQAAHNSEVIKRLEEFRSVGPRFTAKDGDDLCEDVRTIQRHIRLPERECTFGAGK
jgi:hypothetical protein